MGAQPDGFFAVNLSCETARLSGLVRDVSAMLPNLRRCLTMPNGNPPFVLFTELAFAQHLADPRVRALAAELSAAEQRARAAPEQTAR